MSTGGAGGASATSRSTRRKEPRHATDYAKLPRPQNTPPKRHLEHHTLYPHQAACLCLTSTTEPPFWPRHVPDRLQSRRKTNDSHHLQTSNRLARSDDTSERRELNRKPTREGKLLILNNQREDAPQLPAGRVSCNHLHPFGHRSTVI